MKKLLLSTGLLLLLSCTSQNPQYTPIATGQPDTNSVVRYIPDPRINQWSNTINSAVQATAPVNPYAGITGFVVNGALALWGALASLQAARKNGQVNTLAAGIVKAGPTAAQAVLDHAATTPHFSAVATAINEQTGANQNITGTTKT